MVFIGLALLAGCVAGESETKFDTFAESHLRVWATDSDALSWFGQPVQSVPAR